ncbi:hypothetical protein PF010_g10108 [Phytophthora fragariae]|uniref:Secreted protein n=1 Tax=Phytophthora fragariae TaxID=53985 RepID=A0A6G0L9J8_9STRA|nr:hypothetical protein PF010_g10108 [Phytophthora fragariae]KAE9244568.1 hypothetical protein PF004_g5617 [Phytophthora fragariae]
MIKIILHYFAFCLIWCLLNSRVPCVVIIFHNAFNQFLSDWFIYFNDTHLQRPVESFNFPHGCMIS